MVLDISADGSITGIVGSFTDGTGLEIDPGSLGSFESQRQGVITQDESGQWFADMHLACGPVLGPFPDRPSTVLAEIAWLLENRF